MLRMLNIIIVVCLFLCGFGTCWTVFSAREVFAQQPAKPHTPTRVVERKVAELHRFPAPIARPTHPRPYDHPGYRCHWHPHYGWVYLPVAVAPRVEILEAGYALPATVYVPEVAAAMCPCPWCGQPITLGKGQ